MYLVTTSRHHSMEASSTRFFIEENCISKAIAQSIYMETDVEVDPELIQFPHPDPAGGPLKYGEIIVPFDGEEYGFAVWTSPDSTGWCESLKFSDISKYDNRWVEIQKWEPREKDMEEAMAMDQQSLAIEYAKLKALSFQS